MSWTGGVSTSFEVQTSVATSGAASAGSETVVTTASEELAYSSSISSAPDVSDGSAAVLGGGVIAVGDDTLAIGTIEGQILTQGSTTVASGTATFSGIAESEDGATVFAEASTFVLPPDGDIGFSLTYASAQSVQTEEQAVAVAISTTTFDVLDFETGDVAVGETLQPAAGDCAVPDEAPLESPTPAPAAEPGFELSGNLALFAASVEAVGEDTFTQVDAFVLTVEDQLSTIDAVATFAVG